VKTESIVEVNRVRWQRTTLPACLVLAAVAFILGGDRTPDEEEQGSRVEVFEFSNVLFGPRTNPAREALRDKRSCLNGRFE
jgi:hypothetical protein